MHPRAPIFTVSCVEAKALETKNLAQVTCNLTTPGCLWSCTLMDFQLPYEVHDDLFSRIVLALVCQST